METIKVKPFEDKTDANVQLNVNPYALKFAMDCRGYNQTELSEKVNGLHQSNLSKFLRGYCGVLSEDMLKKIMAELDWPYEFLFKELKPLQTSKGRFK